MMWSLEDSIPSFDFATAVVILKTTGHDSVLFHFGDSLHALKHNQSEVWSRLKNLLIPLADLAGLKWRISRETEPYIGLCPYGRIQTLYRDQGIWKFPLLKSAFSGYVTVTLRNMKRELQRNSSPDWERVIKEINRPVIVMRDDMTIEERMRLYSGAYMNLGVNTGPMALCHFSEAPYLTFNFGVDEHSRNVVVKSGLSSGSQFDFRNEKQLLVWEPDTYETVMKYYQQLTKEFK
jgi:hypothetical protein